MAEHTYDYDPDGNRSIDVSHVQNADNHAASIDRTATSTYDPRDRLASLTKVDGGGATVDAESYVHDANNNVVSQTVNGTTTAFTYDRNRLVEGLAGGVTSAYNYDPFGRLNTITSGGQVVERHTYDGFDRIREVRRLNGFTDYTYDPLDRTKTRLTNHGAGSTKETDFTYIGLSNQLSDEVTEGLDGQETRAYQYSPTGQRLSQTVHNLDGTTEDGFYGYNAHSDVEDVTTSTGDTKATYAYTAYGSNDTTGFSGIDPPDPQDSFDTPYNAYRFNAKRFDPETGSYDMGFRDYNPGLNQFLTRDTYNGALADMGLTTDPYTGNRYAYGAGNPYNNIELDGHLICQKPDGYDCGKAPDYNYMSGGEYTGTVEAPQDLKNRINTAENKKSATSSASAPMVIEAESGLCVAECAPITNAVDTYYRMYDCEGLSRGNVEGLLGGPCELSRDDVQRLLLKQAAKVKLQQDRAIPPFAPFLPNGPDNAEIADRIARHIGDDGPKHGFGKLSTDEIGVQIESLLNRAASGDRDLFMKTIREGQPSQARVIYDPDSKLMVVVNPSGASFGTALGDRTFTEYSRFGE